MSEFLPEGLDVDTILVPPCGVQHAEGTASVDTPPSAMTSSVKILSTLLVLFLLRYIQRRVNRTLNIIL